MNFDSASAIRSAVSKCVGAGGRGTRILPLEAFRRFKSGSIFQCFPGAKSTELMTSIGKPTPHLAVFDPSIPIYNWRGNERGILQLFLLPGQFSLHRKLWA